MKIFESFEKAIGLLNSIENSEKELYEKQSVYDQKIQYWLHYLENSKISTKQSYRITRELKHLREERRQVKNDLDLLRSFHTSEDKLKGNENRSMLMGQLRKLKNKQENWVYENDVYSNEEIERILG